MGQDQEEQPQQGGSTQPHRHVPNVTHTVTRRDVTGHQLGIHHHKQKFLIEGQA